MPRPCPTLASRPSPSPVRRHAPELRLKGKRPQSPGTAARVPSEGCTPGMAAGPRPPDAGSGHAPGRLHFLHRDPVRLRPGILADAGDHPGHPGAGQSARNDEASVAHGLRDEQAGHRGVQRRELVAEVAIQGLEPVRHFHDRRSAGIEHRDAVVDVLHVRRFHEGVVEVLVLRIQRVVDAETAAALAQAAVDLDVAEEAAGQGAAARCAALDRDVVGAGRNAPDRPAAAGCGACPNTAAELGFVLEVEP